MLDKPHAYRDTQYRPGLDSVKAYKAPGQHKLSSTFEDAFIGLMYILHGSIKPVLFIGRSPWTAYTLGSCAKMALEQFRRLYEQFSAYGAGK